MGTEHGHNQGAGWLTDDSTTRVSVTPPEALVALVDKEADRTKESRSATISRIFKGYLSGQEKRSITQLSYPFSITLEKLEILSHAQIMCFLTLTNMTQDTAFAVVHVGCKPWIFLEERQQLSPCLT